MSRPTSNFLFSNLTGPEVLKHTSGLLTPIPTFPLTVVIVSLSEPIVMRLLDLSSIRHWLSVINFTSLVVYAPTLTASYSGSTINSTSFTCHSYLAVTCVTAYAETHFVSVIKDELIYNKTAFCV